MNSSSTTTPVNIDNNGEKNALSIIISRLDRIETMLFELKDSVKINKITEHHNHQHPSSDLIEIQTNQQINNDNLEQQQQQMDLSSDSTSLPDDDDDDEEEYFTSVESNDESSKQTCSTRITTNNVDDSNDNGHQSNVKNTSLLNKDLDSSNMIIEINDNSVNDDDDTVDVDDCLTDQHQRIHSCDKQYKCHHCRYATEYKSNLKIHIRRHTGDKPFKCDNCQYATVDKSSLQKHIRIHKGDKIYKCDNCQYATAHNSSLKSHKLRIHPSCH